MDRESTITHLQIVHTWAEFARERDLQFFTPIHLKDIAEWTADALELLKEQEAVEPKSHPAKAWTRAKTLWFCGACGARISKRKTKFCQECGRKVMWE